LLLFFKKDGLPAGRTAAFAKGCVPGGEIWHGAGLPS